MSIALILGAIGSIATIFGAVKYWSQLSVWLFKENPDKDNQSIDKSVSSEEQEVEKGGRPKWDE